MKIFFVLLMLLGTKAHAVKTADCPKNIEAEFGDFKFHLSFNEMNDMEDDSSCVVDCYNEEGMALAQKELEAAASIKASLQLAYTLAGRCFYSGQFEGKPFTAEIAGTFSQGSANKARLISSWQGAAIYSNLVSMSPEKIELATDVSTVYYVGEHCSYGECVVDHIFLGTAGFSSLKAK